MPIHDWTHITPGVFHDFHLSWICSLSGALNGGALPAGHYALIELSTKPVGPDWLAGIGPVEAVTDVADESDAELYRRKQNMVTVRRAADDRVVAVIEIVSPGNKGCRAALGELVGKAADLLGLGTSVLLLDLLPPATADPDGIRRAIWMAVEGTEYRRPADKPLTAVAYAVGANCVTGYVEPLAVGDPLPNLPLFLGPGGYVLAPLEATYTAAWNAVPLRWRRVIDPAA